MFTIRAGSITEANPSSGEWAFVDPGFASKSRSCGLLLHAKDPVRLTFAELQHALIELACSDPWPLNLAIEAPLSVAFGSKGNPCGRSIELRNGQARYWYVGLGCSVLVSTTFLLRSITEARPTREIRLFEGLVSFKEKGVASDHCADVLSLKSVVWGDVGVGRIVPPTELAASPSDRVVSAFQVAGMNYGIPPVIAVGA